MKYPIAIALLIALGMPGPLRASAGHDHGEEEHPPHDEPAAKEKPKPKAKAGAAHAESKPAPADAVDAHGTESGQDVHDGHDGEGHEGASAPKMRIVVKGAMERLKDGNQRYLAAKMAGPRRGKDQRALVSKSQLPFAVIVGCADSRVPPEIIFDQGLGDLFVVRVAGNVLDDPGIGSIEYAVEHLGSRLIVVLGHERCGAVDAACKGGNPGGHVGSLVEAIRPAVEVARRHKGDNLLADAVKANVQRVVDQLKGSWPVLGPEVREEKISIVGAVYDLETGLVEFIP